MPHHRTDLILRKVNLDRYDDRDLVRTNLIESYERIIAFVQKHLPDPFLLEGMEQMSLRDAIFREVASNIMIHREYTNAFPAKLIIERGQVRTENSNNPHGFGALDPATFTPFPKNPVIGAFFREIHRADELGSGMRKMMRYGKAYGGADLEMIEGDVFRIVGKVTEFSTTGEESRTPEVTPEVAGEVTDQVTGEVTGEVAGEVTGEVRRLLKVLDLTPLSRVKAQSVLGLKGQANFRDRYLEPALGSGLIEMTIPDKPRSSKQKYRLTDKGRALLELTEREIKGKK